MSRWFFFFFLLLPLIAAAQINRPKYEAAAVFDTSRNMHAELGEVRISIDKYSGRFSIERRDGTPILFTRNGLATSYTNVRIGYHTYSNNFLYSPQTPEGTRTMPLGYSLIGNNEIVFRTTINSLFGEVAFEQRFTPTIESNYHFIRITTKVTNKSGFALPLGALHVFDLMAGGSDACEVLVNGLSVDYETGFKGNQIPQFYSVNSNYINFKIRGRLDGAGLTKPNQFVVGRWQYNGYLGAVNWDYEPSRLRMGDNALLMQWNQNTIQPGKDFIVATDYGLESNTVQKTDAEISCYVSPIIWNDSTQAYVPNPFDVRARVTNTGNTPLNGVAVVLGPLLNGLSLATGETAAKSIPGTINSGSSVDVIWRVVSPIFDRDTIVQIPMRIFAPPIVADTCIGQTTIPAARIRHVVDAEIYCGPPITLKKDNLGAGFEPNPFFIEPTITNTGTEPLDSLFVSVILPQKLTLISDKQTQLLNPFPLAAGLNVKPIWVVLAQPAYTADTIEYVIRLQNKQGIFRECRQKVFLPAVDIVTQCEETTPSTSGREFWFNFPLGTQPGITELSIFVAAQKHTDVRIIFPQVRDTIISHIFPKNVIQFPGTFDGGIHLLASEPVRVYIIRKRSTLSEVTSILPIDALGTMHTTFGASANLDITAIEDGTIVPGATLQKGETKLITRNDRMTFDANKPINILRNAGQTMLPGGNGLDGHSLIEFIPSHGILGREYVVVPFLARKGGDLIQIVSAEDGNALRINGVARALPNRTAEVMQLTTEPTYITADKLIEVMQYTMPTFFDKPLTDPPFGDGSMVTIMPVDRFSTCHLFTTLVANHFDFTAITLVIHEGAQKTVALNGRLLPDTLFHPVRNFPFRYARLKVPAGTMQVSTSEPRGVGVLVYGFGMNDGFSFNSGFLTSKNTPVATGVDDEAIVGSNQLGQNYPNPFGERSETGSPVTNIVLRTRGGHASLKIFDLLGREIATVFDGVLTAGEHTMIYDGRTNDLPLPTSVYFYRLQMDGKTITKRMVVMR